MRIALEPTPEGFRIATTGQSLLGPFDGTLGLVMPRGGATRIDIEALKISNTAVTGALTLGSGAVSGNLALAGGGLDGTILLAARGGGQGLDVNLRARNASFGGATPIPIARADIQGQGTLAGGNSLQRQCARPGSATDAVIGRFAAQGQVTNGTAFDASIAGRRASSSFSISMPTSPRGESRWRRVANWQAARSPCATPRGADLARGRRMAARSHPIELWQGDMIAEGRFAAAISSCLRLPGCPCR